MHTFNMFRSGPSLLDKTASIFAAVAMIATVFSGVVFSLPQSALAATTSTLTPDGQGTYGEWSGGEADLDETGSVNCGTTDSNENVSEGNTGDRESVDIDLSGVPNGATINSVAVTVYYRDGDGSGAGGTFQTFARFNGTNLDSGTNLEATSSSCGSSTQTLDVADSIKSDSSTLEIGVLKTGADTDEVWVGAIRVVVTYTDITAEYVITGSATVTDQTVSLAGTATANPFVGNLNDQHISIDWDDDGNGIADSWVTEDSNASGNDDGNTTAITFDIDSYDDSGGDKYFIENNWSANHAYSTAGAKKIFVQVHHASTNGTEGSDAATIELNIVIPETAGKLVVVKNVVNTGGGTATASSFSINVKSSSVDVSGSPAAGSTAGTTYTLAGGNYVVSEGANSHYTVSFSGACDSSGNVTVTNGATSTCTVTNTFHNTTPDAQDGSFSTDEDTPYSGSVSSTDTDGDAQTYGVIDTPDHAASFTLNTDGTFSYTPAANYNGSDSFTFGSSDGYVSSDTGTISITVNPVNDNPTANEDSQDVDEDSVDSVINVLGNDSSSPDSGETLTVTSCTDPVHGTVSVSEAGVVTYTPDADFNGEDTFNCTISDGNGGTATASVTIDVGGENDAPIATNDSYNTSEDTQLDISAPGVLGNDSDIDGDTLQAVLDTDVSNGTLTLNSDGSFTYVPNENWNGTDSFTYHATDSVLPSDEVTVTIDVEAVNDAPVAQNDSVTTESNTAVSDAVVATDVDGDSMTYTVVDSPVNGTLVFDTDTGLFTYTPTSGYVGSDSFTFKANDGDADSNVATISITVEAVSEDTLARCTDDLDNDGDEDVDINDSDCDAFLKSDLSVAKTVDGGTHLNGASVTYTITVTNDGPADAQDVVVTDILPTALTFSTYATAEGTYNSTTGVWAIGALANGATATLSIGATINALEETLITNSATASMDGVTVDENYDNNTGSVEFTVGTLTCPTGQHVEENTCVSDPVTPTDVCANIEGSQSEVPSGKHIENQNQCVDNAVTPPPPSGGGGGSNGPIVGSLAPSAGQVLGASIAAGDFPAGCSALLHTYMRIGKKGMTEGEVKFLQQFLNDNMNANLPITGVFGPMTDRAVKEFQTANSEQVLTPWGLNKPTGFVYKTTQRWINLMFCKSLNIPMPTDLTPYMGE